MRLYWQVKQLNSASFHDGLPRYSGAIPSSPRRIVLWDLEIRQVSITIVFGNGYWTCGMATHLLRSSVKYKTSSLTRAGAREWSDTERE